MQANQLWWLFAALQVGWSVVVPPKDRNNVCTTNECKETATRILNGMKSDINPCDDFYEFTCGSYISKTAIPPQRTAVNRFVQTMMKVETEMESVINTYRPPGGAQSPRTKMHYMFKSCKKPDTTEAIEIKNLKAVLKDSGFASWPKVVSTASPPRNQYNVINEQGWNGLFGIFVEENYFNPGTHTIFMDVPNFEPLTERAFRDLPRPKMELYKQFIVDIIKILYPELTKHIGAIAESIYDFELELMKATTEDSRIDPKDNRKLTTLKDVEKLIGGLPWKRILKHPFEAIKTSLRDSQSVIIWRLEYYKIVSRLISQKSPEVLFNYLGWKRIVQLLSYTRSRLYTTYSQFMGSVDASFNKLSAQANCIRQLMKNMKYVFGDSYTSAYFKLDVTADISEIITYLKESLINLLEEREKNWLDTKTRSAAIKKVRDMYQIIGYPNWIKEPLELQSLYQFLPTVSDTMSYVSLMNMTLRNNFYANLKQLPATVVRNKVILQDPAIINAEYIPQTNALVLYAGLLQSPFYQKDIPIAVKMGATGWTSAHELTHGLDTLGSQFDATGKLHDWWSPEVRKRFTSLTHCFTNQYSAITDTEAGMPLYGLRNLRENIADNGGMRIAYKALQTALTRTPASRVKLPGLEKYTAEQLFFISFGSMFCNKMTTDARIQFIRADPHTVPRHRVNVALMNSVEFSSAFSCRNDRKMNPRQKCVLW
ncbi:neprilysin-11-like [Ixodes scapularis]|uniref:neprilysin-11-like n=1 Tax=Ixodes scapularis TaxID=6945 RepID=UPI001A9D90F4|nr:neprilysin-11-like [Ixodes scapularis]